MNDQGICLLIGCCEISFLIATLYVLMLLKLFGARR